jgi:O-antigen ligase
VALSGWVGQLTVARLATQGREARRHGTMSGMLRLAHLIVPCLGLLAALIWTAVLVAGATDRSTARLRLAGGLLVALAVGPAAIAYSLPREARGAGFGSILVDETGGSSHLVYTYLLVSLGLAGLLLLLSVERMTPIPLPVVLLLVYLGVDLASASINGQALTKNMLWPPIIILGLLMGHEWTLSEAVRYSRWALRLLVWGSLGLLLVKPSSALYSGQGRAWLGIDQLAGLTTHPNGLGAVAAIGLILEVSLVVRRRGWQLHAGAAFAALLLSQSRGSWLGAALGLGVLALANRERVVLLVQAPFLIALGATVWMFGLTPGGVVDRLLNGSDASTLDGRTAIWQRLLDATHGHEVIGLGPLIFDPRYRDVLVGVPPGQIWSHAHNQFLQSYLEAGLIGLALLIGWAVMLTRASTLVPPPQRGLLLGILVTYLVRFATETSLSGLVGSSNMLVLCILLILVTSAGRRPSETRVEVDALGVSGPDSSHLLIGRGGGFAVRDVVGRGSPNDALHG